MLIFRMFNCIFTASGTVTLCERPYVTLVSLLKPNDIYIYIYIYMSYRSADLQTLHFKYLFNKYTY